MRYGRDSLLHKVRFAQSGVIRSPPSAGTDPSDLLRCVVAYSPSERPAKRKGTPCATYAPTLAPGASVSLSLCSPRINLQTLAGGKWPRESGGILFASTCPSWADPPLSYQGPTSPVSTCTCFRTHAAAPRLGRSVVHDRQPSLASRPPIYPTPIKPCRPQTSLPRLMRSRRSPLPARPRARGRSTPSSNSTLPLRGNASSQARRRSTSSPSCRPTLPRRRSRSSGG